jgi:hypothetical protein
MDMCMANGINGLCGPNCPVYGEAGKPCADEAVLREIEEEVENEKGN